MYTWVTCAAKLEAAGAIGCTIETVRGMGYRIKADGVTSLTGFRKPCSDN